MWELPSLVPGATIGQEGGLGWAMPPSTMAPHLLAPSATAPLLLPQFVTALLGYAPNDRVLIALCSMGKVFVGELVEEGEGSARRRRVKMFANPGPRRRRYQTPRNTVSVCGG